MEQIPDYSYWQNNEYLNYAGLKIIGLYNPMTKDIEPGILPKTPINHDLSDDLSNIFREDLYGNIELDTKLLSRVVLKRNVGT